MTDKILEVLRTAAQKAGDEALAIVRSGANQITVKEGIPGADFFTKADITSQDIILQHLQKQFPKIPIISEEQKNDDVVPEECFVIDPIDGTIIASNGASEWAVMIAYLKNHQPTRAVVYIPGRNLMVMAAQGNGCYLNDVKVTPRQWAVDQPGLMIGMEMWHWWNTSKETQETRNRLLEKFNVRSILSAGYGAVSLVKGETPAWVNGGCWIWDCAPGQLFTQELGGITVDFTGKPLDFSTLKPEPTIHAANQEIADILVALTHG